jgi:HEPN domain-containing protein
MNQSDMVLDVEKQLAFARGAYQGGAINLSDTELILGEKYTTQLSLIGWDAFVQRGDYHYFVARLLLSKGIDIYGLFCAHQCVETYLKAYLKKSKVDLPKNHKLRDLLKSARTHCLDPDEFLNSEYAETICIKYEPFYELARYPVQNSRPKGGQYIWMSGEDEKILDYFVYRMRQLLPLVGKGWDILTAQGHYHLDITKDMHPSLWEQFQRDNLNFV